MEKASENRFAAFAQRFNLWNTLYFIAALLYAELLLHCLTNWQTPMHYGIMILFSVSFAVLAAATTLVPIGRLVSTLLLAAMTVFFCVQYFLFQSFQTFMGIMALTAADDVAGDFAQTILIMILKGFWVILLFALPFLLYLFIGKKLWNREKHRWYDYLCYFVCFAVFYGAGIGCVYGSQEAVMKYKNQYEFSAACQNFGLLTGTRLDLKYLIFGNASETELQTVEFPVTTTPESEQKDDNAVEIESQQPEPVTFEENVMDIDFDAISDESADSRIVSMNDYIHAQSGSMQHEYTGLFAGKNLILITAEAFSAEVIDPELTPTLYRLANNGIQFTEHYQPAWGGSTSTGEFSNITGLIPTKGVSSIQLTADKNMYFTLGNQLQRLGYYSCAYHNNTYTYYDRHLTHNNLGYSTYIGMGNGMEAGVTDCWPQSDLEMMQFTLQDYIDQQPFSIYYMTVSGHGTYQWGANAMSEKNKDAVAHMDASETIKGYYAANLELEYALTYLVEELEKAGIADDTVIVIAADHYPYALEASATWGNSTNYLPELYGYAADSNMSRDHSALIIWSGCLETEQIQIKVDTPTYSLDIVPTLSNLFGLNYDSRLLVGRDALSDQMPLVIWRDYSWLTDRGYYNAASGTFTPRDGQTADQAYIDAVNALVQNKYALSNMVLEYDYYGILFGEDDIT